MLSSVYPIPMMQRPAMVRKQFPKNKSSQDIDEKILHPPNKKVEDAIYKQNIIRKYRGIVDNFVYSPHTMDLGNVEKEKKNLKERSIRRKKKEEPEKEESVPLEKVKSFPSSSRSIEKSLQSLLNSKPPKKESKLSHPRFNFDIFNDDDDDEDFLKEDIQFTSFDESQIMQDIRTKNSSSASHYRVLDPIEVIKNAKRINALGNLSKKNICELSLKCAQGQLQNHPSNLINTTCAFLRANSIQRVHSNPSPSTYPLISSEYTTSPTVQQLERQKSVITKVPKSTKLQPLPKESTSGSLRESVHLSYPSRSSSMAQSHSRIDAPSKPSLHVSHVDPIDNIQEVVDKVTLANEKLHGKIPINQQVNILLDCIKVSPSLMKTFKAKIHERISQLISRIHQSFDKTRRELYNRNVLSVADNNVRVLHMIRKRIRYSLSRNISAIILASLKDLQEDVSNDLLAKRAREKGVERDSKKHLRESSVEQKEEDEEEDAMRDEYQKVYNCIFRSSSLGMEKWDVSDKIQRNERDNPNFMKKVVLEMLPTFKTSYAINLISLKKIMQNTNQKNCLSP